MITTAQLQQYLSQLGVTIPDFMLQAFVDKANGVEACLIGAGMSDADILLVLMYSAAVMSIESGSRRVKSQSAPSGASQSYEYSTTLAQGIRAQIRALDTAGCTGELLTASSGNFFMVLK